jgi:hypothetical protein
MYFKILYIYIYVYMNVILYTHTLFLFVVLRIKPRDLYNLGKCSTELHCYPWIYI